MNPMIGDMGTRYLLSE